MARTIKAPALAHPSDNDTLTPSEAAAFFRISTKTLAQRTKAGSIPAFYVAPRCPRYSKRVLQSLLTNAK